MVFQNKSLIKKLLKLYIHIYNIHAALPTILLILPLLLYYV